MIIDDIAITLEKGLDSHTLAHLIEHFGSAEAVYSATPEQLMSSAKLNAMLAKQLAGKQNHSKALEQLRHINRHKITPLDIHHNHYPKLLRESYAPSHLLYAMGDSSCLEGEMLTMVGTRNITHYGQRVCNYLISGLAELFPNLVIVSGLAYGIDAECHRAALNAGLRTVAVVKDVLPEVSPSGNSLLATSILDSGGCIISEANLFSPKHKGEYIKRNRIMASMSMGTVLVEALAKGGANSTAQIADEINRVVMAVPGRLDDKSSMGCNNLIKAMKARMVSSAWDIAHELGWEISPKQPVADSEPDIADNQRIVLDAISHGEVVYVNALVERCAMEADDIIATLFELELLGLIRALPGSRYEKI